MLTDTATDTDTNTHMIPDVEEATLNGCRWGAQLVALYSSGVFGDTGGSKSELVTNMNIDYG